MILSFARHTPDKELTNFRSKILSFDKFHTLRVGDFWKVGMFIHFWDMAPRKINTVFPKPEEFFIEPGSQLAEEYGVKFNFDKKAKIYRPIVQAVEYWQMNFSDRLFMGHTHLETLCYGKYDLLKLCFRDHSCLKKIAQNDGLSHDQFCAWFEHAAHRKKKDILTGQIIHWTNFRYHD